MASRFSPLLCLAGLVVAALLPASLVAKDEPAATEEWVIPRVVFNKATLTEAVEYLRTKMRTAPPSQPRLNIVVLAPESTPLITLQLQNATPRAVLEDVARQTGLRVVQHRWALVLQPASLPPVPDIRAESPAIQPLEKMVIPRLNLRDATLRESIEFMKVKSASLAPVPPKHQLRIVGASEGDAAAEHRVSVDLTDIPILAALHYLALTLGLELEQADDTLTFVPQHL